MLKEYACVADPAFASAWAPRGAWDGIFGPGRLGAETGPPGLVVAPVSSSLVTIMAARGRAGTLSARLASAFGLVPPATPRMVRGEALDLIWSGSDQWLARADDPGLADRLTAQVGDIAAISDQSAARAILRLAGPCVREVLAKGCMIDLHPSAFRTGDTALTQIAHIGVQIWQTGEEPVYEIAVSRSYAGSFWSWLSASAAEYGCEMRD